jgi:hypothetical protein
VVGARGAARRCRLADERAAGRREERSYPGATLRVEGREAVRSRRWKRRGRGAGRMVVRKCLDVRCFVD